MSASSLGRARRHRARRRHAALRTAEALLTRALRHPRLPDDLWGDTLVALVAVHGAIPPADRAVRDVPAVRIPILDVGALRRHKAESAHMAERYGSHALEGL